MVKSLPRPEPTGQIYMVEDQRPILTLSVLGFVASVGQGSGVYQPSCANYAEICMLISGGAQLRINKKVERKQTTQERL